MKQSHHLPFGTSNFKWLAFACLLISPGPVIGQVFPPPLITRDGTAVVLEDYATLPFSSRTPNTFQYTNYPPAMDFNEQLSRANFIRFEPAGAPLAGTRFFVPDLNRNLYIFDKNTQTFLLPAYIDFEATFRKFDNNPGFAGGLITLAFHPEYATNGIFYTVHMENPGKGTGSEPANPNAVPPPGYTTNAAVPTGVGGSFRQSVLIEWTDTNINNTTFEGTARELMRLNFTGNIHPMGDLIFNPLAGPGHPDYGNLYIAVGDGGAGESGVNDDGIFGVTGGDRHFIPQRLDTLLGKILRITPDTNLRPADLLSSNGPYRIPSTGPDPNPFVLTNGVRPEIFAYGFRNPHRLFWDAPSGKLITSDIGYLTFEEVNIVHKGTNYGWASREGTRTYFPPTTGQLPPIDVIPMRTGASNVFSTATPRYPVAEYHHNDGDAVSSGVVYRGTLMPQLYGKFIFADITTARLFYCNLDEMIAADDDDPWTLATIHEIQVVYNGMQRRFFDVIAGQYHARGGTDPDALPGLADATEGSDANGIPYGKGRADIRLAVGDDQEIYVISKSDGTIRKMTAALSPSIIQSIEVTNGTTTVVWSAVPGRNYQVQFNTSLSTTNWTDVPGVILATGLSATNSHSSAPDETRYYRVFMLP